MEACKIASEALFAGVLLYATISDTKARIIPNKASIMIAFLALIRHGSVAVIQGRLVPLTAMALGIIIVMPLIIVGLTGSMGGGDFKLVLSCGAFLGYPSILMALALALVCVLVAMSAKNVKSKIEKKPWDRTLPFAPYMATGTVLTMVAGVLLS